MAEMVVAVRTLSERSDSWDSCDSFAVVSERDFSQDEQEEEELDGDTFNFPSDTNSEEDAMVDADAMMEWEDIGSMDVDSASLNSDDLTFSTSSKNDICVVNVGKQTVSEPEEATHNQIPPTQNTVVTSNNISPRDVDKKMSKSFEAREALKAFYLARAKENEKKSKQIVISPPLPAVIQPLKAPERYDIAVREEVKRTENAKKAQDALKQFYRNREIEKQKRAALNRENEPKLFQTQRGLGALLSCQTE